MLENQTGICQNHIQLMAIAKKIISKKIVSRGGGDVKKKETPKETRVERRSDDEIKPKKVCAFCKDKTIPAYTDIVSLKRYINDRSKIVNKSRSGACSKHQRMVMREIKYARHLALLPFTPKV